MHLAVVVDIEDAVFLPAVPYGEIDVAVLQQEGVVVGVVDVAFSGSDNMHDDALLGNGVRAGDFGRGTEALAVEAEDDAVAESILTVSPVFVYAVLGMGDLALLGGCLDIGDEGVKLVVVGEHVVLKGVEIADDVVEGSVLVY